MNNTNSRPAEWGLPTGTRVQLKTPAQQKGTVMPYEPEYTQGLFPVRLDNGIWQRCHTSDVIVLAQPKETDQRTEFTRTQGNNHAAEPEKR
jgi:hypothetical protein